jgi:phosphatidylserine decarboxylase
MMGRLADLEGPPALVKRAIDTFVRVYGVDLDEAIVPETGFGSFDEFFTRRLREGARSVAREPAALVCPSDGVLAAAGAIDQGARLTVKGRAYEVGDLLGDASAADRFAGGSFAVIYLAPPDYHRVHAPLAGDVELVRYVPGTLYPVNSIGEHVPRLFARNERMVVHQRSHDLGEVVTILVGAIGVGRVTLDFAADLSTNRSGAGAEARRYRAGEVALERGDDLGTFHLGSTVVLLIDREHPVSFVKDVGERTSMGQLLAKSRRGSA